MKAEQITEDVRCCLYSYDGRRTLAGSLGGSGVQCWDEARIPRFVWMQTFALYRSKKLSIFWVEGESKVALHNFFEDAGWLTA